jgi:hypothetical protein
MYLKFDTHTEAKQAAREGKTAVVLAFGQTFLYLPSRFQNLLGNDLCRLVGNHFRLGELDQIRFELEDENGCYSVVLPSCWRADWYTFDERHLRAFVAALDQLV